MKFYKQKTEIQKTITLNFKKKLLSDTNKFEYVSIGRPVFECVEVAIKKSDYFAMVAFYYLINL